MASWFCRRMSPRHPACRGRSATTTASWLVQAPNPTSCGVQGSGFLMSSYIDSTDDNSSDCWPMGCERDEYAFVGGSAILRGWDCEPDTGKTSRCFPVPAELSQEGGSPLHRYRAQGKKALYLWLVGICAIRLSHATGIWKRRLRGRGGYGRKTQLVPGEPVGTKRNLRTWIWT